MKHYNPSISENAARIFNSKQGDYLGDDVQGIYATVEIKNYSNIVRSALSVAAAVNLYTTPTDKDFYLVSAMIGHDKAVGDANTNTLLVCTPSGDIARNIMIIPGITLTAERGTESMTFDPPIKLQRNTNITLSKVAADGNSFGSIVGYTVETTKGV